MKTIDLYSFVGVVCPDDTTTEYLKARAKPKTVYLAVVSDDMPIEIKVQINAINARRAGTDFGETPDKIQIGDPLIIVID